MVRNDSQNSFTNKKILLEQNPILMQSWEEAKDSSAWKKEWTKEKKVSKSKATDKKTETQKVPSDREINDAISNAIFDKNENYVSFSRYEDEKIVEYLYYSGIIKPTEGKMSYTQKFLIDPDIGKEYIHKYKTIGKRIELVIVDYPMIWAGAVWICAAIISSTIIWFINRFLETYIHF